MKKQVVAGLMVAVAMVSFGCSGRNAEFGVVDMKAVESKAEIVKTVNEEVATKGKALQEDMSKEMYKPFVVKRLVEAGLEPSKALQEANDHTESAQRALKEEMEHRPLLLNRAPTLHK